MNANRFTQKSLEAIQSAQQLAETNRNTQLEPIHLLKTLTDEADDLNAQLLASMQVDMRAFSSAIDRALAALPTYSGDGQQTYAAPTVSRAVSEAEAQAKRMGDAYVSVEHLMLGLLEKPDDTLKKLFSQFRIQKDAYLTALKSVRGNRTVNTDNPEGTYDVLKKYGQDLVELARAHKLDPVIGRDNEIRSIIRILSRKTKNNPCLIGEPGVGKTAIAEGLALRIVRGDVPDNLKDR
ncbi:MAG: type VI secretion system ATPase TssH, partial [Clostridia bacterium]|nr:type VI secretion system ATPase TssH [Clostridia bacterium]